MKHKDPIIMQLSLASQLALEGELYGVSNPHSDLFGGSAVLNVEWLEKHGDLVTLISEHWSFIPPNIFVSTSPKK